MSPLHVDHDADYQIVHCREELSPGDAAHRSPSAAPGSPPAPIGPDSATASPVQILSLRAASDPGPGRSRGEPYLPRRLDPVSPTHMQHSARLCAEMAPFLHLEISKISFSVIADGLRDAVTTAACHATELANEEHSQYHQILVAQVYDSDVSVTAVKTTAIAMRSGLEECEVKLGSLVIQNQSTHAAVNSGRGFDGGMDRLVLEYQIAEFYLVLLEAAPQRDGSCLSGDDRRARVVGLCNQDLMVLAMVFVGQFSGVMRCRHLGVAKASIVPNRNDTHTLHRLVDDLFAQLQGRLASGVDEPAAFRTLLADVADYFDRYLRGSILKTLQKFGVPSGMPFSSFLRSFRVVVASTVDEGGPLAPSPEMAIEFIRIRTVQQYPMLIPILFPGNLPRERDRMIRLRRCGPCLPTWNTTLHRPSTTTLVYPFFRALTLMLTRWRHYRVLR